MEVHLAPSTLGLANFLLFVIGICLYRAFLPKPIPGIPYNKASAGRLLGDAPDVSSKNSAFFITIDFSIASKMAIRYQGNMGYIRKLAGP